MSIIVFLLVHSWLPAGAMGNADALASTAVTQELVVVVNIAGATLFQQPNGATNGSLPAGAVLTATGRSQDGAWLYVEQADGQSDWLPAAQVLAFGIEELPVLPVEVAATNAQPALAGCTASAAMVEESNAVAGSTPNDAGIAVSVTAEGTNSAGSMATDAGYATVTAVGNVSQTDEAAEMAEQDEMDESVMLPTGALDAVMHAEVVLSNGRLNIRSGPGTSYTIVGKAYPQGALQVLARDASAAWVQIVLPEQDGEVAWVSADYLQLTGAMADLPVADAISGAATLSSTVQAAAAYAAGASAAGSVSPMTDGTGSAPSASGSATGLSGTLVFQTNPGGTIYAYDLKDGRVWPLTHGFDPAISPDGRTVAFTRDGGENGIYLIDIGGGSARLIFSGRSSLASPKWSPDGQWILFSRGDEYWECRTLGFGTCVSNNFTGGPPGAQPPGFSIKDLPILRTQEFNLAVVDTNGDNYHDIAALETARTPDWNEAGIVYQSSAGIQRTADAPDAENQLVSFDYLNPYYYDPDWQPGGGRILFQMRGASHWEIYSFNADGSNMINLTRPVTALVDALPSNVAPAWSPDGQHIVYASNRGEDNSAGPWRLWVMDADGSNQHPLPLDVEIDYTFGGEQIVSWGP